MLLAIVGTPPRARVGKRVGSGVLVGMGYFLDGEGGAGDVSTSPA